MRKLNLPLSAAALIISFVLNTGCKKDRPDKLKNNSDTTDVSHKDATPDKAFKNGERVTIIGNSIVQGGHYHSYVWLYYMTRFPDRRITIYNCGISGETAQLIYMRLDDDVFPKNPTVMTLSYGLNDTGWYELFSSNIDQILAEKLDTCYKYSKLIEKKFYTHPAKKIMITNTPYDHFAQIDFGKYPLKKYEANLKIVEGQRLLAKANGWDFFNFWRQVETLNKERQKTDPTFTVCGTDRIHPNISGHLVMAYYFLKNQGLSGYKVAEASFSAKEKKLISATNCTISNLAIGSKSFSFDYLAKALPFPVDTKRRGLEKVTTAAGLDIVPFTDEFNQEIIRVSNLPGHYYKLSIDGIEIGRWTVQDFAKGINLALKTNTPQYKQAMKLLELNEKRWNYEQDMRRYMNHNYGVLRPVGLMYDESQAAVDAFIEAAKKNIFYDVNFFKKAMLKTTRDGWQAQMNTLTDQICSTNKPAKHKVEVEALW